MGWACYCGQGDVVDVLLKAKANLRATDSEEMTPFHRAVQSGSREIVTMLLAEPWKVSPFIVSKGKVTPLHLAAKSGSREVAATLLDCRVDVNVLNGDGATPLQWASEYGAEEVKDILLERGA